MAAGLGFKDFTTGEVLTAADVDGYLMQGVWVFASAAARDAAVTSPQEGNFAYLKDTNVTTYYTGSAWANLDTTGMTNPMTTTGDTIYSSSGSTPARLGIGSTGDVLTVAGGVPTWAAPAGGGAYTLLSTTTLSGASTTISISGTGYTNLLVFIYGVTVNSNGSDIGLQPNSQTTNTNWSKLHQYSTSTDIESGNNSFYRTFSIKQTGGLNNWTYIIYNINSSQYKSFTCVGGADSDDSNRQASEDGGGVIKDTNAITSLKITAAAGSHGAGTVLIYGEK